MRQPKSRRLKGFTLIELMVTIIILGIIVAVAVPSYRAYIVRSYLSEAFDGLSVFRVAMEQAYQDNSNYGAGACAVDLPTASTFNFSCALTNGGQGFTATATGNGNKGITGYTYAINDTGARTTTAFPTGAVPASCWLTTTSGC